MQQSSNLDLLRSTAVLSVLFGHMTEYGGIAIPALSKWQPEINELTYFAVLMFFIHTSLVLMMSLARLEKSDAQGILGRFYIRRAARIYPLAILVVCVCYAFHIPRFPGDTICGGSPLERMSNILLTQNLTGACEVSGPLWSLPYELQMYALLPFAYWLGKKLKQPLLLLVAGFALWFASRKSIPGDIFRFSPWFAMGIYAFFLRRRKNLPPWVFCLALVGLVSARPILHRYVHHYVSGWILYGVGIVFCTLLPMVRDISAPYIARPAATIAKYSYGIYLLHAPLMWLAFVRLRSLSGAVQQALFFGLLITSAVVLFHLVEAPMIRWGTNFTATRRLPAEIAARSVAA